MGLFNRSKRATVNSDISGEGDSGTTDKKKKLKTRRKSFFQFISPSDVTTESLQVWAGLPQKIRQDPSMVSFQMEHDRLHGKSSSFRRWYRILTEFFTEEGLVDIEVKNETALDSALPGDDKDDNREEFIQHRNNQDGEEEEGEDAEEDRNEFIMFNMPAEKPLPVDNENEIRSVTVLVNG